MFTRSDLNKKVKELDCTQHWRKFYKDEAQRLKNLHPTRNEDRRTGDLAARAGEAIGFRRKQLQNDWATHFIEIGASAAIPNLDLPAHYITNAAVMLFTSRAMKRLGLDDCSEENEIYKKACSRGGVQEKSCRQEFWAHLEYLVTKYQDKARLELMWHWLNWFLTELKLERSADVANKTIKYYKSLKVASDMEDAWETTHNNHERVLKYLEEEATNYHIGDLIPPAIEETK